jgi:hypothetical protein
MKIETIVSCDFCGGGSVYSEENVIKTREHEPVCRYNPANRACVTCEHLEDDCCGAEYCEIQGKEFIHIYDGDLPCDQWEENK